jgi:hypothetical protein
LYRTKDGRKISADVNGAYNIVRKSRHDAFARGNSRLCSSPRTACRINQTRDRACAIQRSSFWNYRTIPTSSTRSLEGSGLVSQYAMPTEDSRGKARN